MVRTVALILGVVTFPVPFIMTALDWCRRRSEMPGGHPVPLRPSKPTSADVSDIPADLAETVQMVFDSPVVSLIAKLTGRPDEHGALGALLANTPQEQERLLARKAAIAQKLVRDFAAEHPNGDLETLRTWLTAKNYEVATKGVPEANS
jgi:hypothetical protein